MIIKNNDKIVRGYQFIIWSSSYRNDKWSHTNERFVTIDAISKENAKQLVELRGPFEFVDGNLKFTTSEEYIYRIDDLGLKQCRVEFYYGPCEHNWKKDWLSDDLEGYRCSICGVEQYDLPEGEVWHL